jgi:hypothetical protein
MTNTMSYSGIFGPEIQDVSVIVIECDQVRDSARHPKKASGSAHFIKYPTAFFGDLCSNAMSGSKTNDDIKNAIRVREYPPKKLGYLRKSAPNRHFYGA